MTAYIHDGVAAYVPLAATVMVKVVAVIVPTMYPVLGIPAAAFAGVNMTAFGAVVYVLPKVTVRIVAPVEVPVVVIIPQVSVPPAVIAAAVIPA